MMAMPRGAWVREIAARPAFSVFVISVLLSLWAFWQNPLINNDGILYLRVARAFVESGVSAAFHTYNWPFLGILIGATHALSGMSYHLSAVLWMAILMAFTCAAYVVAVKQISDDRRVWWWAVLIVLTLPKLVDYRDSVIRDTGYWAFSLLAFVYLVRAFQNHRWRYVLVWLGTSVLATVFRIESVVILLAMPVAVWFCRDYGWLERLKKSGRLWLFPALGGIVVLAVGGLADGNKLMADVSGYFSRIVEMREQLMIQSGDLANYVLKGYYAVDEAPWLLLWLFLGFLVLKSVNALGLHYVIFMVMNLKRSWFQLPNIWRVAWGLLIAINLAMVYLFVMIQGFISSRYLVLAVLIAMLPVPLMVVRWLGGTSSKWPYYVVGAVAMLSGLNALNYADRNNGYLLDSAKWASTYIPANSQVLVNHPKMGYVLDFAYGYHVDWDQQRKLRKQLPDKTGKADYLVYEVDRRNPALAKQASEFVGGDLIKTFESRRGDKVFIMRLKHEGDVQ